MWSHWDLKGQPLQRVLIGHIPKGRGLFSGFLLLRDNNTSISARLGLEAADNPLPPGNPHPRATALRLHLRATHRAHISAPLDWLSGSLERERPVSLLCIPQGWPGLGFHLNQHHLLSRMPFSFDIANP